MIEYRTFHNADPPQLVRLWHQSRLGRGAAFGFSFDALETAVLAQPYFDPAGMILAVENGVVLGFVHAGFGGDKERTGLDRRFGVVCAVLVHPDFRRRGIGRELVARAEAYLKAAGATTIDAGPADPHDPFYVGLYGGSEPAGFLESDPDAAPFCTALGYQPVERHLIFQRDNSQQNFPISFRLMTIRRKTELGVTVRPRRMTWWWLTRFGRLDSIRFLLVPKSGGKAMAGITVCGLDCYLAKWNERAVGLTDLYLPQAERRKGYGQALVVEVCRKLHDEMITRIEAHAAEGDTATIGLLQSAEFEQVDVGVVYRKDVG